jgi:pre-mRNA cleavage complex 2 protein Pcf11
MVADDHAESKKNAAAIYKVIRELLISPKVPGDRKLPLVYVVDSILKNVKGMYIPVIEDDASTWLPVVYQSLSEEKRAKLKKVYNLWKNAGVFSEASWKQMGASFTAATADTSSGQDTNPKLETAGIIYGVRHAILDFQLSNVQLNRLVSNSFSTILYSNFAE